MNRLTTDKDMQTLWATSHLNSSNAAYLEQLFEDYMQDPDSLPSLWRGYFDQWSIDEKDRRIALHSEVREQFRKMAENQAPYRMPMGRLEQERKQVHVLQLITTYRLLGHRHAQLDPLGLVGVEALPELTLLHHQLSDADLDVRFNPGTLYCADNSTLRQIMTVLRETYCGHLGVEYMHLIETTERRWLQQRLETVRGRPQFETSQKRYILDRLTAAEGLERYLHSRYVGQKRFSLEGGESLIPMLDALIQQAGTQGVKEIIIGMAHRGRLNVLVNILGKSPQELFHEFEGRHPESKGTGDVKYHMGFSSDMHTPGGSVHLALAFNPSHLEIVNPVVEGSARARQERSHDREGDHVLPVLLHGDAAFSGQGVVMETLNMSQTRGFSTKGTVHIVINNQIGFTTSTLKDARSTYYCTDVAKMVNVPILHVNADNPEMVVFAIRIALEYRMTFKKDVVIDLVCYRRHGHNEVDEPGATQPLMYQRIKALPTTRALYAQKLVDQGVLEAVEAEEMVKSCRLRLEEGASMVPHLLQKEGKGHKNTLDWSRYIGIDWRHPVDTKLPLTTLQGLWKAMRQLPESFELHPRVAKIMDDRHKMAAGSLPLDWGFAENMAYATLLDEGFSVRISGQDSGRGTFFHRHVVLFNQKDERRFVPLREVSPQNQFLVIDSLLSEEAVLAFEYGYATAAPDTLVIWEAQFGDFANGAQVVIDQFISSGEQKWGRLCGLVLLLPHGYEGQGPEHSSARIERFLQLCAQQNMQVCVPTTPAQIYHLLRRQMCRPYRKPLIVMTPKSLLRHKLATSTLEDLTQGQFFNVMDEIDALPKVEVTRVLICSGKIYYDLLEVRRAESLNHIAIIRLEQIYPFPDTEMKEILASYDHATEFFWVQEEPLNQGAWYASQHHIRAVLKPGGYLKHIARAASASPAVGYFDMHIREQKELIKQALG